MVTSRRLVLAVVLVVIVVLGSTLPAIAQGCDPDQYLCLPAGTACSFELQVGWSGGNHMHYKEFLDQNGNVARSIQAGKGLELTFTNLDTGATLTTPANGAVNHTTYNADGSKTVALTGHNVIFMFPTDNPPGPSTTLYVGRVEFTIDPLGNYTLGETSGIQTDICAALSD